jgi:lysophospholipase L1-like esterase
MAVGSPPQNDPCLPGRSRKILLFPGLFTLSACLAIAASGIKAVPHAPSQNPYYTEGIHYPPDGAWKAAAIAFIVSCFLYVTGECLWGGRLGGWKRAAWVSGWVVFILAAVEISIGLFTAAYTPLHRPHPVYLWELYPNHHAVTRVGEPLVRLDVNRHGFRGGKIPVRKPPGTFRIMILGDSSAFGYGVGQEEVFAPVMEMELARLLPGRKIEVINAAVPGYTTFSSSRFFLDRGMAFAPDVVMVAHNNDPDADWDEDRNRAATGPGRGGMKLLYRSGLYMLLRKEILNARLKNESRLFNRPPAGQGVPRVSPTGLEENLNSIGDGCRRINARFVVVSMPLMEDGDETLTRYREIMKKSAARHGGEFIDIYGEWQEGDTEGLFLDDVHPNAAGHGRIGKTLARRLVEEKLVK